MGLREVLSLQREFSDKIDGLCRRPVANSQEQVDEWQNNNIEYLKVKAKNVKLMPKELEDDIDILFEEHQSTYQSFVESWYEYGFRDFQKAILILKQKNGDISKEKMREDYNKIEDVDIASINEEEKIGYFFFVFENIINAINEQKNWFDIYKGSGIRGDGLVLNISSLDLFTWQLPNADLRDKNNYKKIAKIMIIFFFIESIHKNEHSLSNDINPFDKIVNLDKIVSYYKFLKVRE